jgi:hypothetical protein
MRTATSQAARLSLASALSLTLLILLPACKINVNKADNGEEKKVDIRTPLGGIQVNNEANARDTGISVYPGAHEKPKSGNNGGQANVNISSGFFGVKVVVVEFLSDDAPEKVTAYYRDQLKKFGNVLECHTTNHGGDPDIRINPGHDKDRKDNKLSCDHDSGPTIELKVGTQDNQHVVAVSPQDSGKGTDFALVYVATRGGAKDTI